MAEPLRRALKLATVCGARPLIERIRSRKELPAVLDVAEAA